MRARKFRSANYSLGGKVTESHLIVGLPVYLKSMIQDFCNQQKISMSGYAMKLILADLRPKIKKLDDYMREVERVQEIESKL